jgi:uncharacterized membrane protein YhiD involved in acid resistance
MLDKWVEKANSWKKAKGFWKIFAVVGVVLILLVLLGIVVLRAWLRSRERATLGHSRDVALEAVRRAEYEFQFAESKAERLKRKAESDAAIEQVVQIDMQLAELEKQHKQDMDAINNIKSWDDVHANVH